MEWQKLFKAWMSFKNFNRQLNWVWQPSTQIAEQLWTANQKSDGDKNGKSPQIKKYKT